MSGGSRQWHHAMAAATLRVRPVAAGSVSEKREPHESHYLRRNCSTSARRAILLSSAFGEVNQESVMPCIETTDRTRLFYVDGGAGKPAVFLASAWLSSRMWEFQLPYLIDQGVRCIACDRRGHGRSDWTWVGYDYDTLADDLAALLEQLDLRDVTLVGHSAGGGEAVRYLTRHGAGRIERIVLVSATTPFPMKTPDNPHGMERALMEADMAVRTADRPKWFADNATGFFGLGLPGVSVSPEFVEFMIRQCLDCSTQATAAFFLTGFVTDLRPDLRDISVPTLIIHGDRDVQAPISICGQETAKLVPNSTLVVYENAAHGLFVTHANRLNADLLAFTRGACHGR
jgi:pimeloyl-ACP methyl ester carboxylesterase